MVHSHMVFDAVFSERSEVALFTAKGKLGVVAFLLVQVHIFVVDHGRALVTLDLICLGDMISVCLLMNTLDMVLNCVIQG